MDFDYAIRTNIERRKKPSLHIQESDLESETASRLENEPYASSEDEAIPKDHDDEVAARQMFMAKRLINNLTKAKF